MTQVVLPHTIDAGTEITAVEHQENYVAIRDTINGLLEGGSGVAGNIKADSLTARELADILLSEGIQGGGSPAQEGVMVPATGAVTPGAGLNLNVAAGTAWVNDDTNVVATGALLPVIYAGGSVAIASNSSGNPRIDQVILTVTGFGTGTVSVLQGTPTAAATLDNRSGAAALPNNAIRLADILMPNGFAGPFVAGTHIRDRRQVAYLADAPPTFIGYRAAALTAVAATWTKTAIDTVEEDAWGYWDSTNNRWIPKQAGLVEVTARVEFSETVAGTYGAVGIGKNGTRIASTRFGSADISNFGGEVATKTRVNGTTDYIEHFHLCEGARGLVVDREHTALEISLIGT